MPVPPSQPQLQGRGTCPSASGFAIPLPDREGTCHPCFRTAISLSPPQFHLHPQCHLPTAPALTGQSHRARAASAPQLQQQTRSQTHAAAGPRGSVRGAAGQAAPPGTGGEAGLRQAEGGGAGMGKAGRGHLFLWPEHTCPFTASSSTITSLGSAARPLGTAAICPRWPGSPPEGDFVTDTSGWGGGGQGVRHDGGGGEECAPLRRFPRMGWGGGHPSMSQLKRWCFTSMSCTPSFSGFFSFSSLFIGSSQS